MALPESSKASFWAKEWQEVYSDFTKTLGIDGYNVPLKCFILTHPHMWRLTSWFSDKQYCIVALKQCDVKCPSELWNWNNVSSSPGNLECVDFSALSILLNKTRTRNKLEHWPGDHLHFLIASMLPGCFGLCQFFGKQCLSLARGIAHAGINSSRQY